MRKICVFTGTRADYSRLYSVMRTIQQTPGLELHTVVAGMHLIEKHGLTVNQIREDNFPIDHEVFTLIEGETLETMTKSVGLTITEMATVLRHVRPDVLLVHGDRFEVFGAAVAGSMLNIPIAHLQGGEVTGSIDESLRHAITKLAHIHFPSNPDARERLTRLGENPEMIFCVGCPMVDKILEVEIKPREHIFGSPMVTVANDVIHYEPDSPYLLVIYHPVTSTFEDNYTHTIELLKAVQDVDRQAFWLWPNADAGAREIVRAIKTSNNFFWENIKIGFYRSFPIDLFVNILNHCSCVVGNSSVGMREACYFGKPVVNIGSRQDGRIRTRNIRDVVPQREAIREAILQQCEVGRYPVDYVYGDGNAGRRIAEILATIDLPSPQKKITY